ncbi:hypothetical protein AVENP_0153 [Arcobacter venerupis]|uniref:Uncharacterized protein n=1 Tax=Arcobacter venerupis TaxID=1054033 RepID=A0AAE7B5L5_9BACT|nr:hypothetical protein [Arcobacter venerupis]QKF65733.1 hypothetical protein AVENP_0153 [Arcobacter venerupis]RWS50243.1 hypothetical protein CKA56_04730 [Arcobacter venerupis]
MPYFVSSIIAIVSAMIIMFTRYEADDSSITAELDRMKSMFLMVDGFTNTYVQSGGDLTDVNFQKLSCSGILSGNIKDTLSSTNCDTTVTADGATDNVTDSFNASKLTFPSNSVIWQLIPVPSTDGNYGTSSGSAYKLLVDMRKNSSLMSKAIFAESFSGREFCEKMLFGTLELNRTSYDPNTKNFTGASTNKSDGLFVCIVFK